MRNDRRPASGGGPTILALGDSYTEGYAVVRMTRPGPAHLERDTGRRVLAGGVRDYGSTRWSSKAERLVPAMKPGTVVLAFIASDIDRTRARGQELAVASLISWRPARGSSCAMCRYRPRRCPARYVGAPRARPFLPASLLHEPAGAPMSSGMATLVETGEDGDLVSCRLMGAVRGVWYSGRRSTRWSSAFRRYEDWAWPSERRIQDRRVAVRARLRKQARRSQDAGHPRGLREERRWRRTPKPSSPSGTSTTRANALAARADRVRSLAT